jgi:hypothetical protein
LVLVRFWFFRGHFTTQDPPIYELKRVWENG